MTCKDLIELLQICKPDETIKIYNDYSQTFENPKIVKVVDYDFIILVPNIRS